LRVEQQVRYAHLNVVGFTGEDQQRFVLGFPAKPRDGAVVSVVIQNTKLHPDGVSERPPRVNSA